jgi:hypothetical protein
MKSGGEIVGNSDKPQGVALTGWLCVIAGGLTALFGALFALVGALVKALSQQGTELLSQTDTPLDPLSLALMNHFGAVAASFIVLGVASLVIGVQFLRMRPSARLALEILAWLILVGSVVLEIAALAVTGRGETSQAPQSWVSSPVTSLILTLLQILACVMVIRFVRNAAVRAAFKRNPPLQSR